VTALRLAIDRIVVETDAERAAVTRLPEVLRDAMVRLAERWATSPWARSQPLVPTAIQVLEVEPIPTDELLGPRGADLLAERLWRRFLARVAGERGT
jgi:hypothetical protein